MHAVPPEGPRIPEVRLAQNTKMRRKPPGYRMENEWSLVGLDEGFVIVVVLLKELDRTGVNGLIPEPHG